MKSLCAVALAAGLFPSCSLYEADMVPKSAIFGLGHNATIAIETSDATSSWVWLTGSVFIGWSDMKDALTLSIEKSRLFTDIVSSDEADYLLSVHVYQANSHPVITNAQRVHAWLGTSWRLTQVDTGKVLWEGDIRDRGDSGAYRSLFTGRRQGLALEDAARGVIGTGLRHIGAMDFSQRFIAPRSKPRKTVKTYVAN
jgi:hypothetical protein